jgi:hypothetical protein
VVEEYQQDCAGTKRVQTVGAGCIHRFMKQWKQ